MARFGFTYVGVKSFYALKIIWGILWSYKNGYSNRCKEKLTERPAFNVTFCLIITAVAIALSFINMRLLSDLISVADFCVIPVIITDISAVQNGACFSV